MRKQAGVMLIVKDGLILSISRKDDKNKFGLVGGKCEKDESPLTAALRETLEETGVTVHAGHHFFTKIDGDFEALCYYATVWEDQPQQKEDGVIAWLTEAELIGDKGAFAEYNTLALQEFRKQFPDVKLK